jgi:hypothetical protein
VTTTAEHTRTLWLRGRVIEVPLSSRIRRVRGHGSEVVWILQDDGSVRLFTPEREEAVPEPLWSHVRTAFF